MDTDYQNKHYNINQKDEGTLDDQGRDGGTNFILRIKEQETQLTLQEHDDDFIRVTALHIISNRFVAQRFCYLFLRHVSASVISHLQEAHKFFMCVQFICEC